MKLAERNLVRAIEKSLTQAQKPNISVIKQQEILAQLHQDISQPIDVKFKKLLSQYGHSGAKIGEIEEKFDRENPCNYFYELISRYYLRNESKANEVHSLAFHHLITNHHFPSIYALLFHRWLFAMPSDGEQGHQMRRLTLSRCNIFLKGTNRLFWSDVENYTFRYKSLFSFLKQSVLLNRDLDQIFQFMEIPTMPLSSSSTSTASQPDVDEKKRMEFKSSGDLGYLGEMGGDIDVRIGERNEQIVKDDPTKDTSEGHKDGQEQGEQKEEEEDEEDDICDSQIDHLKGFDKMSREEQMARLTSEEWNKRRLSQTEDTRAQFMFEEEQVKQAMQTLQQQKPDESRSASSSSSSSSSSPSSSLSSPADKPQSNEVTSITTDNLPLRDQVNSPELQYLMDKTKQMNVIESKKRDLISLVAKYFFYYEDRNSRMQLPNYIYELANKCASNMYHIDSYENMSHEDEDEYDEISQLDEVGGWASLFNNTSVTSPNSNSSMIDYRRFSITDPSFNEMFEDSREFDTSNTSKVQQMISDIFVTENIFLLSVLNNEKILVSIMNNFKLFKQLDISSKCKVKLQAALYAATRPGPPNYPPRTVRHKAQEILDDLFPKGRYIRFLMNSSFRVLHHFTWPMSILYWFKDRIESLFRIPRSITTTIKHHFVFDPKQVAATPEANEPEDEIDEEDHYYLTKYESL